MADSVLQLAGSCVWPACEVLPNKSVFTRMFISETHWSLSQLKIFSRALFKAWEEIILESSKLATREKKEPSGDGSQHTMWSLSAQEGECSHSQPPVTSVITASWLAFFPFQMLMQYLYYGGTESMEIPTTDILEVRVFSSLFLILLSALGHKQGLKDKN